MNVPLKIFTLIYMNTDIPENQSIIPLKDGSILFCEDNIWVRYKDTELTEKLDDVASLLVKLSNNIVYNTETFEFGSCSDGNKCRGNMVHFVASSIG